MAHIPIINIGELKSVEDASKSDLSDLATKLVDALCDVGFLYVVNHGIPKDLLQAAFNLGKDYFQLPKEVKLRSRRDWRTDSCGYQPVADDGLPVERFDLTKPADVKEAFDVCHNCPTAMWPNDSLPQIRHKSLELISASQNLILRLMSLLGYGLQVSGPDQFVRGFHKFNSKDNTSQLRYLYYPPISGALEEGQMRCGEHSDYGCLTLVFMDSTPGLQVYTRKGKYMDVPQLDDAILVNVGDLMQRWTGDRLHSAKHRVIFRPDTVDKVRYSVVYFAHPDDDVEVKPVTGNVDKYPPVRTAEHMNRRFKDSFEEGKGLDQQLKSAYV